VVLVVEMVAERVLHEEDFVDKSQSFLASPKFLFSSVLNGKNNQIHVPKLNNKQKGGLRLLEQEHPPELDSTDGLGNRGVPVAGLDEGELVFSVFQQVIDVEVGVVKDGESFNFFFFLEIIKLGAELKLIADELMVLSGLFVIGLELSCENQGVVIVGDFVVKYNHNTVFLFPSFGNAPSAGVLFI
jgi:hypothetical protein